MSRRARPVEKSFLNLLDNWTHPKDGSQWQDAAPGFRLQAWESGKLRIDVACGETSEIYDWASLTKIVMSVSSTMIEVDEGHLSLKDPVVNWLPELLPSPSLMDPRSPLGRLTIRDLLCHSAGMTWWKPFYKQVSLKSPGTHEEAWTLLFDLVVRDVRKRARSGEISKAQRGSAIYSDLDFFLLGEILRRSSLMGFPEQYARIQERLGLKSTFYNALSKNDLKRDGAARPGLIWNKDRVSETAPTEFDSTWRKRGLKSEVHDENTSSLKGIAPHAGLFGPIGDLSRYGLELRKLHLGMKSKLPLSGRKFLDRAVSRSKGDWALGFMMPTKGSASCGPKFSLSSIGHTGFTGTSLWYDPKSDLLVTILSNRVHPTRKNTRFLQLRPALHTLVKTALQ